MALRGDTRRSRAVEFSQGVDHSVYFLNRLTLRIAPFRSSPGHDSQVKTTGKEFGYCFCLIESCERVRRIALREPVVQVAEGQHDAEPAGAMLVWPLPNTVGMSLP